MLSNLGIKFLIILILVETFEPPIIQVIGFLISEVIFFKASTSKSSCNPEYEGKKFVILYLFVINNCKMTDSAEQELFESISKDVEKLDEDEAEVELVKMETELRETLASSKARASSVTDDVSAAMPKS